MNNKSFFTGIQQIGIGVPKAANSFKWYNENLGLNIPLFDDIAEAKLMTPHTDGVIRTRRAILAVSLAGGGGAEIWESKSPLPLEKTFEPKLGDLGIYSSKIKASDIRKVADKFNVGEQITPEGKPTTWLNDNFGNKIQIVEDNSWFKEPANYTGGVLGAIIGVSDMDTALKLYKDVLGISDLVYDKTGIFEDFKHLDGGNRKIRRVLLRKPASQYGAFSKLLGNIEIELVQLHDIVGRKIFAGRSWGDLGYIHLCFDTLNIEGLKERCQAAGYPFTVDSSDTFAMGKAGGRFAYIEDQDGTLLEFVETHKVPMLKKIGWYKTLDKSEKQKPLPNWMIKTLGLGKVKPEEIT